MRLNDPNDPPSKKPPLFWWIIANTLAIAFAITSWVICVNFFTNPLNPTSYKWMLKVGRLDPLESFNRRSLPSPTKIAGPLELERQFANFPPQELQALNRELKRAYLTNFDQAKFVAYVTGEFRVLETRPLKTSDFIPSGIAVKAQALIQNDNLDQPILYPVIVECLFPTNHNDPSAYPIGSILKLTKQSESAVILNIGNTLIDERPALHLTTTPLLAFPHQAPEAKFKISPPKRANPAGKLPAIP